MAIALPATVIDALLMGVGGRRRQLQDFPVLGDVWARYAERPGEPLDLLFTPTWEKPTGDVARLIARTGLVKDGTPPYQRRVSYIHGLVVGSLSLDDLTSIAMPATRWWDEINDRWNEDFEDDFEEPGGEERHPSAKTLHKWIEWELAAALREETMGGRLADDTRRENAYDSMETEDRQAAKLGLLLGILRVAAAKPASSEHVALASSLQTLKATIDFLGESDVLAEGTKAVREIILGHEAFEARDRASTAATEIERKGVIFQISLNRDARPAMAEASVNAIKADAARSLFSISCKGIGWAVLDSGIDQTHRAFWDYEKIWRQRERQKGDVSAQKKDEGEERRPHRIKATFDFRRIRAIMSVEADDHADLIAEIDARTSLSADAIRGTLAEVSELRSRGERVDWQRVRPLIEHDRPDPPPHPHGTHVAGIIGAHWLDFKPKAEPERTDPVKMDGVCPDIALYDFRVLGSTLGDSEFAVIAALQFIRFLNEQSGYSLIHGANLSLSIPHNVRNYACGRTEVCVEAEALSASGVVVVAAAGNRGFQQYRLADNSLFDGYAASSITDPGNAEGVITVGATHRAWPHTYGVSFFSSRGPTGDGRMKPDLLAPGEKITSCVPGNRSDEMDGTSMAAPHVSGAAALLMARHEELKGQPTRIKQILCDTATDLKRERSFQGHGMVDVLRAIQSL
jgi:subtilisin family serine protease